MPDSVNITDKQGYLYGKFDGMPGIMNSRCADFTYEQFVVLEWKQFQELARRRGGQQTGRMWKMQVSS